MRAAAQALPRAAAGLPDRRSSPDPVCWTEAPDSLAALSLAAGPLAARAAADAVAATAAMIGRPRYGAVGMFGLPYFVLFEALGPIVEVTGYAVHHAVARARLAAAAIGACLLRRVRGARDGVLASARCSIEERAFQRYRRWSCFGRLVFAAGLENLGYRQWYALVRVHASWSQLRHRPLVWGEMARSGFTPASVPSSLEVDHERHALQASGRAAGFRGSRRSRA